MEIIYLILGVIAAGFGGELFVRGSVGLASWARIPPSIVAATIAAFATSSPELAVSVSAASNGTPSIALGDALGSNVVNIGLILGITLLLGEVKAARGQAKRDYPFALLVPIITGILFYDGTLSRIDGAILLSLFFIWLGASIREARAERANTEANLTENSGKKWPIVVSCLLGLGLLFLAGNWIVTGASGIAKSFGIAEFIIGATIVSIGTSVPELATAVIAKMRGHDEVGVGTVLGSNIFNGLLIVAVAALIHPIEAAWNDVLVALLFGLVMLVPIFPHRSGSLARGRGFVLIGLYLGYLIFLMTTQSGGH